jgi:hypothetical protein
VVPPGGGVRTALLFGVPRLRGSRTVRIAFDIPGLPGDEPAAPEDFWTRLKAELRTGFAHPNAPAARHRRTPRPRTQADVHPVPASSSCRGARQTPAQNGKPAGPAWRGTRNYQNSGSFGSCILPFAVGALPPAPRHLPPCASSMVGVLHTRGWYAWPVPRTTGHGSRITGHRIPLYTLSARFYNEIVELERRGPG